MKRTAICIAAALVATLTAGAMVGCSSQPTSSANASAASSANASSAPASASASSASASVSSASASSSAAAERSQDALAAEMKDVVASIPAFKSVTVNVEDKSAFTGESEEASTSDDAAAEPETITEKTVYKFDESGDKIKTSAVAEVGGVQLRYFTDGEDAVFVTDGSAYSGTTEQFDLPYAKGFKAFLDNKVGDLNTLVDCAASIEKMESNGLTFYLLTLDPEKYIASDEVLTLLADSGTPVKEALFTVGFEEDGSFASMDLAIAYENSTHANHLLFSDYDNTVIDPMPAADKTFEEMEADMQAKLDELNKELESTEGVEGETASQASAEVK